mmetsp:Transcript_5443/g.5979  ORF Transcript_5443/g.5979 Transcript_5443/m.5979 type:complete len:210 (-) Transcript_5443:55-684(-)
MSESLDHQGLVLVFVLPKFNQKTNFPFASRLSAECELQLRQYRRALNTLQQSFRLGYTGLWSLWLSVDAHSRNYPSIAVRSAENLTCCSPKSFSDCMAVGNAWEFLANNDLALQNYNKAAKTNRYSSYVHYRRGLILFKTRQDVEAFNCFETALNLNPEHQESHLGKIKLFLGRKEFQRMTIEVDEVIEKKGLRSEGYQQRNISTKLTF